MFEIKNPNSLPVKVWLKDINDIEKQCVTQIDNLSHYPFAFHHIAVMPDVHMGYGMPIGGVMAVKDVIVPNAVGVDIGCGMCAVRTSLQDQDLDKNILKQILGQIRREIPLGFSHYKQKQDKSLMPPKPQISGRSIVNEEYNSALTQVGTLGGGNHFIEVQKDEEDFIWLMVHSGSRNIGFKVANYYNKLACQKYGRDIPGSWSLAYLPIDSNEGQDYFKEMQYCVDFAFASRKQMIEKVKRVFRENFFPDIRFDEMINIAHNYASKENHFGCDVYVHRKGATQANEGQIGIIPGSQGTSSYIVKGKGNPDSFMSCSHGSGRVMSRKKAIKQLNLQYEVQKLEEKGILHAIRSQKDLDEASSAYKNIEDVMGNQEDLVEVLSKLYPLAVVKG